MFREIEAISFGNISTSRPAFLRFLLPTGLDARQNLSGLRYIACAPEPDGHAFDDL